MSIDLMLGYMNLMNMCKLVVNICDDDGNGLIIRSNTYYIIYII